MKIPCTFKARLLHIPTTAFLLSVCSISTVCFVPVPGRYETPREAVEYVAWKALKEGRPPCVTVHPIGISLFCVMGHCTHGGDGKPYCKCNENFTGLTCSVYVGKCATADVCAPHLCQDDPTKASGFKCVCSDGYHVPNDPNESFCVKNEETEDIVESDAVNMAIPAELESTRAVQQKYFSVLEQHVTQTEPSNSYQLATLTWKEDNSSGMAVLCASSDFLICFIDPKDEDKAVDALFKRTLLEVIKRKRASLESRRPLAGRHNEHLAKHATQRSESFHMDHLLTNRISKHAAYSRSSKRGTLRDRMMGAAVMQRRAVSTFQTLEKGIFARIVSGIDSFQNMSATNQNDNSEHELKAGEEIIPDTIPNEGSQTARRRISSGYSNCLNKLPDGPKAPFTHVHFSNALSLNPPEADGEGTKSIRSLENQPHPAAYSAGSEIRKSLQKSHSEEKPLTKETADEIIDDLKIAVQVSEHDKPNITNTSHVSDVSVKLSNIVQARDEDDLKSSDDNLSLREVASDDAHSEEPQMAKKETGDSIKYAGSIISLPDRQHKLGNLSEPDTENSCVSETPQHSLSDSDEQHIKNEAATSEGATTGERKIPSPLVTYDYARSRIPKLHHPSEKIPSAVVRITNPTDAEKTRDNNKPVSSEVAAHHSKKERNSYVSLREGNRTFALSITQHEGERTMKVIHPAPLLLFNVTVLSKQKNSTSWHVVPTTGTNAVLISWDVYNPEAILTAVMCRYHMKLKSVSIVLLSTGLDSL